MIRILPPPSLKNVKPPPVILLPLAPPTKIEKKIKI